MFTIEPETPKSQAKELEKRKQSLEEQRRYHEQYLRYKSEKDQFLRKKPYSKSRITPALKQVLRGFGVVCFLVLVFVLVISLRRNFRHGFSENQKIIKDIKISEKQINKSSCANTKQGKYYLTDQYERRRKNNKQKQKKKKKKILDKKREKERNEKENENEIKKE
ncbi:e3 ubiquitin-protein ligase march6 [Anaeramoeba flamelloides]|uniref:E3 ubiquitin-protein ligase march6 n=1 Tax=Anaeramoeba flamelloides TaxID=1746091 RepID=A0ABQ8XBJ7_9EUKA|nr:e3 ubiquitin-protein ligase march6 [Anaeramoeba flamelloides]